TRARSDRITDPKKPAPPELQGQAGTHHTSLVSVAVTRDSRDNVQLPSRGGLFSWAVDVAGLGGDVHYVKTVASATYFRPMWLDHILSGRVEGADGASLDSKGFPLFGRFYLGGPNSIPSFR